MFARLRPAGLFPFHGFAIGGREESKAMNCQQALAFIHGIARFGSKPGLRRVRLLLERMGNPQERLRFAHVAGTNGKGSVCAMLSHILTRAGYRTGLYISPFVVDFRERIQINGAMIPPEELAGATARVKAHWDALDALGEPPTEFETLVAVAFDYFARQNTDFVVLEVGMGGRFDATNVIGTPEVSVITSLSLEHTEYLGDTIEQIAFEKCGIIKPGGVTVCCPRQEPAAMEVIRARCAQEGNELRVPAVPALLGADFFGSDIEYRGARLHIPLGGAHQRENAAVALEALEALAARGFFVPAEAMTGGMAAVRHPARLEVLGRAPLLVLDGAHNPAGAAVLAKALEMLAGKRIFAVIGMLGNKEADACLREILPHVACVACVPVPGNARSADAGELAGLARAYCAETAAYASYKEGICAMRQRCGPEDALLVCGSLYLASEARGMLAEMGRGHA